MTRKAQRARGSADPIFAAIERHRWAYRRFDEACRLTDEVEAERDGRKIAKAADRAWAAASAAEQDARERLTATRPATAAGARALLDYLRTRGLNRAWDEATSAILLTNVMNSPPLDGRAAS